MLRWQWILLPFLSRKAENPAEAGDLITVLASGNKAEGDAGHMGQSEEHLVLMKPGAVIRFTRTGRTYGAPKILIIDAAYLMKLPKASARMPLWEKMGEIAQVLKEIKREDLIRLTQDLIQIPSVRRQEDRGNEQEVASQLGATALFAAR